MVTSCMIWLITLAVMIIASEAVLDQLSCPDQCDCTAMARPVGGLSAQCRGDNTTFSNVLDSLPTNITHFTFLAYKPTAIHPVDLLFSVPRGKLKRFSQLKLFAIRPADRPHWGYLFIHNDWPLCEMTELEELHLNLGMTLEPHLTLAHLLDYNSSTCLPSLRLLNFSNTQHFKAENIESLFAALEGKPLAVLHLRAIQEVPYVGNLNKLDFDKLFRPLRAAPLRELDFSENGISHLAPGLLKNLPHLTKLVLSGNFLFSQDTQSTNAWILEALIHPKLEYIDVSNQETGGHSEDPDWGHCGWNEISTKRHEMIPFLTNRTALCKMIQCLLNDEDNIVPCSIIPEASEVIDFSCWSLVNFPIGHNLREVHFGGHEQIIPAVGMYADLYPKTFCINPNNSLQVIDAKGFQGLGDINWDVISVVGTHRVQVLNSAYMNGIFREKTFFASFPDLRELRLPGNRVKLDSSTLFLDNSKLELLDLSDNGIVDITQLQFAHLQSLKMLDLSRNSIRTLNFTIPPVDSSQLQLKLNHNNISVISRKFLSELDLYGKYLLLDLSGNIFSCSCQEMYLVEWIHQTLVSLVQSEEYQCRKENGDIDTVASINIQEFSEECNPSISPAILSTGVSVAVLVLVCILVAVVYRKRWHIRYRLYTAANKDPPAPEDDFAYDAFVSYNSEDRQWVHHILIQEIEGNRNRRLFIYMRDMLAGDALVDRIHDAMSECRRHIYVLSPNFLASDACMYELHKAHYELMSRGLDVAILVMLKDLPMTQVPGSLTTLLEVMGYLKWTQDEHGQKLFWDKLEHGLLRPPKRIIRQMTHVHL